MKHQTGTVALPCALLVVTAASGQNPIDDFTGTSFAIGGLFSAATTNNLDVDMLINMTAANGSGAGKLGFALVNSIQGLDSCSIGGTPDVNTIASQDNGFEEVNSAATNTISIYIAWEGFAGSAAQLGTTFFSYDLALHTEQ